MIISEFGLKWKKLLANPNPKSDFDFGLSILIQSTKLDCNPDWAILQSNPAISWVNPSNDLHKKEGLPLILYYTVYFILISGGRLPTPRRMHSLHGPHRRGRQPLAHPQSPDLRLHRHLQGGGQLLTGRPSGAGFIRGQGFIADVNFGTWCSDSTYFTYCTRGSRCRSYYTLLLWCYRIFCIAFQIFVDDDNNNNKKNNNNNNYQNRE